MSNDDLKTSPSQPDVDTGRDPLLGTLFEGKYKIVAKLGEGGMGAVYRAHHIHMDLDVAIKFLHESMTNDPQILERFKREAKAAGRINHPNATQVMDFGVMGDNTAYLVMEYLEGESLRERMYRGHLPLAEAVHILAQACAAVDAAHKKGVIHRDLKPDNIFLKRQEDRTEIVKVLDFGIAKLRDKGGDQSISLTEAGMLIGTPHYMSPEQCHGHELDPQSDVYSLGVIAYELLAGELPFRAPTSLGIVLKHINEEPAPLVSINPNLPRPLEKVVLRALSKRPSNRPSSASQFSRELEAAFAGNDLIDTSSLEASGMTFRTSMLSSPKLAEDLAKTADAEALRTSMLSSPLPASESAETLAPFGTNEGAVRPTAANRAIAKPPVPLSSESQTLISSSHTPSSARKVITPTETQLPFPGGTRKMVSDAPAVVYPTSPGAGGWLSPRNLLIVMALGVIGMIGYFIYPRTAPVVTTPGGKPSPHVATPTGLPEGMIRIEGGTFTMGRNLEKGVSPDETPAHEVQIGLYALGKYEVTCKEYYEFVKANAYPPPANWKDGKYTPGSDLFPVTNVSWNDAIEYCKWLSETTKLHYRLPTEAEWEYAARGKDGRIYPWSDTFDPRTANLPKDEKDVKLPVAVNSSVFQDDASPFKIIGMAGNVSEWTASDYDLYPGSTAKPDKNKGKKVLKITRGGNYTALKEAATTTFRSWQEATDKFGYLGFRLALDIPPDKK